MCNETDKMQFCQMLVLEEDFDMKKVESIYKVWVNSVILKYKI